VKTKGFYDLTNTFQVSHVWEPWGVWFMPRKNIHTICLQL